MNANFWLEVTKHSIFFEINIIWQGHALWPQMKEFFWHLKSIISLNKGSRFLVTLQLSTINKFKSKYIIYSCFFITGKVTNLFGKGMIEPSCVMVLVNAIYFKGQWQNKFQEWETFKTPFQLSKVSILFSDGWSISENAISLKTI